MPAETETFATYLRGLTTTKLSYPKVIGLPTWLWKASTHHPLAPVEARNYGCCCTCCTSKCGFLLMMILWAIYTIFMLGVLIIAFLAGPSSEYPKFVFKFEFWASLCAFVGTIFGIRALQTQKPAWMQLFLIAWALITLIHSALFIYIGIYETKGTGGYFPDRKGHLKQGYPWPVTIAFGVLLLIYHVFMTLLFISYYHFIRDRQLEQEQQQGRMQSIQTYR
ncbi:unnamed protein product, partial [Mesorhabditis spiculigera]